MDEVTYLIAAKLQADLRSETRAAGAGGSKVEHERSSKDQSPPRAPPTLTNSWRLVHLR